MELENKTQTEIIKHPESAKKMTFFGKGETYFGIWIINVALTFITLGLYYPWAKASVRKYLWNETELESNRFVFHGTGKEMFKGFIKVYIVIAIIYGLQIYAQVSKSTIISNISLGVVSLVIFILVPLAIFGSFRYRLSRTSWRGIFFSFKGNLKDFFKLYFKNIFLTFITFGIYGTWMQNNIKKYLISNAKFGNLRFGFDGLGSELFGIIITGNILTFLTLGIYFPWYMTNMFNFSINKMYLIDEKGEKKYLKSTLTGGKAFSVMITNLLLTIVTFGLAFAWVFIRYTKMHIDSIQMPKDIDFSTVFQEADDYKNATGDSLIDALDIGIDF